MIWLTRAQVREIDRRALEEFHLPGVVLMENAARSAAEVAREMLGNDCTGEVLILCGGGNNGGDGLAIARHLHNCGADVTIGLTADPGRYKSEALANWQIISAMGIPAAAADPAAIAHSRAVLMIDAIFGTGLSEPPRDPFGQIAGAIAHSKLPVLAIDIPSGLDCDTGLPLGPCIRATRTITFVALKVGFASPEAAQYLGDVTVGDIGCPRELIEQVAHAPPKSPDL